MNIFPPPLKKLWSNWELRIMVILSLSFQILLTLFGNRRKSTVRISIRVIVWLAYLMADAVAAYALGNIVSNIGEIYHDENGQDYLEVKNGQLTAFWAPFLLLHLGGPDTITAYSIEDNELWLRHVFGLFVQTGLTAYVFLISWSDSHLSSLTIPMILVGFVKYGERVWVLQSASTEQMRESCPESSPNYSKLMEECRLKQAEGYHVKADEVIELEVQINESMEMKAFRLFQTFKRLFVDFVLSFDDREWSQLVFKHLDWKEAFEVIELELGFMYDLLYTKAVVIYSFGGICRRFVTFSIIIFVLVFLSVALDFHQYSKKVDILITFLLLAIAFLLELYAISELLSSDWTNVWLAKQNKNGVLAGGIRRLQISVLKSPRWSNSVSQKNLLDEHKPTIFDKIQKVLHIDKFLESSKFDTQKEIGRLKQMVFDHLKKKFQELEQSLLRNRENRAMNTNRVDSLGKGWRHDELKWTIEFEFDQSILIWYIATELLNLENEARVKSRHKDDVYIEDSIKEKCPMSICIARYMLYLLVEKPEMLPIGIGRVSIDDICDTVSRFFRTHKCDWKNFDEPKAEENGGGNEGKLVLSNAVKLAKQLDNMGQGHVSSLMRTWEMIFDVWMGTMVYAASKGRGNFHALQLRRGGEFLTHVWLLMAHFGLTEHFQIPQGRPITKLVLR